MPTTPPPLQRFLPGLALLLRYQRRWLRPDLVAGVTVGAMLIPQCMAYAELAGMPPEAGFYAVILALVGYALVGSSRHLGTGPEPGTAVLAATGVGAIAGAADPQRYAELMAALALLVAALALGAWLLRLGFVADLLSKPVLVGYITGVGLTLLSSQIKDFTGLAIEADSFFPRFAEALRELDEIHWRTLALGTATFVLIQVLRKVAPRAPGALIGVGAATMVAWVLDLGDKGVRLVGDIPAGLPSLRVPDVSGADLSALLPVAVGVALIGYTDNVLTARSIATRQGYAIDPNQELAGLGVANLAAGLSQGFPVSSSASRSAVPASLGSKTTLVSLLASAFVVVTLLFLRPLLSEIPKTALAAVIISAAIAIIDVDGFRWLWRVSRTELALAATTALGVMVFDVLKGVLIAVALSVVLALGRMARPHDAVLGELEDVDGWVDAEAYGAARTLPGLLVYRFDAPVFFANATRFQERVRQVLEENPGTEEWVILDFEGVGALDATALEVLADLAGELAGEGVVVLGVARANDPVLDRLRRAALLAPDGPLCEFPTINSAVRAFRAAR